MVNFYNVSNYIFSLSIFNKNYNNDLANINSVDITYEEYLALSDEEQSNGTTYYVTDLDIGGGGASSSKYTLLWENSVPTNLFVEQTVTLSSDDYDYLEIYYTILRPGTSGSSGGNMMKSEKMLKGFDTVLMHVTGSDHAVYNLARVVTIISDTEIEFGSTTSSNTAIQTLDAYIIPRKIYGGKF